MLMLRLADVRLTPEAEPDGPRKSDFLYRAFARSMPARKPERPLAIPPNGSCGRRQWEALVGSPSHRQSFAPTIPHLRPQNRGLTADLSPQFPGPVLASAEPGRRLRHWPQTRKRGFRDCRARSCADSGSWGCTSVVSAFRLQRRGAGDLASTRRAAAAS